MKKLYSAFKPILFNCKFCDAPYSHEKTALRCCSELAKIQIVKSAEEHRNHRRKYYEKNKEAILLKQRKYDAKKKENQSNRKKR